MARYSRTLQTLPLISLGLGCLLLVAVLWSLLDLGLQHQTGNPEYAGNLLVYKTLLLGSGGALSVSMCFWTARQNWFFLYSYSLVNECSALTVHDPIGRKMWTVQLDTVRTVRSFVVAGPPRGAACHAHLLEDEGGSEVKLAEALPIWSDIEQFLPASCVFRSI
jgi:hypothetical protein